MVEVGRIVSVHGIRGELRVHLHNSKSDLLLHVPSLRLGAAGEDVRTIIAARRHKQVILVQIEGVTTRNDAEALVGRLVWALREELPPLAPDEIYHSDLIGCSVQSTTGENFGTIEEILETGSNDVCVVRGPRGEVLIPMIDDVVRKIDIEARQMIIEVIPGLLEP